MAEEFYVVHLHKPFFNELIKFMTKSDIYALAIGKNNGIKAWRELMGPRVPQIARETHPNSIRALYGTDGRHNAVHGSDSDATASREIHFFFPKAKIPPLQPPTSISECDEKLNLNTMTVKDKYEEHKNVANEYFKEKVEKTLLEGLMVLVKEKASSDRDVLLRRLGQWLLDHNPNQPRMMVPSVET